MLVLLILKMMERFGKKITLARERPAQSVNFHEKFMPDMGFGVKKGLCTWARLWTRRCPEAD